MARLWQKNSGGILADEMGLGKTIQIWALSGLRGLRGDLCVGWSKGCDRNFLSARPDGPDAIVRVSLATLGVCSFFTAVFTGRCARGVHTYP